MILLLGESRLCDDGEAGTEVLRVGIGSLTRALLERVRPGMILAPLRGDEFDAIEVAERLAELGYRGRFRALTPPLPDPDLVRAEVAEVAPDLDFDLVVTGRGFH